MRRKLVHVNLNCSLGIRVKIWPWVRVMIEYGTFFVFREWVKVLGYGFGVRAKKVKSRDCALASDLVTVRAINLYAASAARPPANEGPTIVNCMLTSITSNLTMRAWPVARSIFDAPLV